MAEQPNISQILAALGNDGVELVHNVVAQLTDTLCSCSTTHWNTNASATTPPAATNFSRLPTLVLNRGPTDGAWGLFLTAAQQLRKPRPE